MSSLSWGRTFLMCPPDHFDVVYAINPWMHPEADPVDPDRAMHQWQALRSTLVDAGASVEVQPPQPGLPDLVFTANAGVVAGRRFVPARFANEERRPETAHDVAWFDERGWDVAHLAGDVIQEGAGDALPFGSGASLKMVAGWGQRTEPDGPGALGRASGFPVVAARLVDRRLYHLDIAFCPLDDRRAMIVAEAFDAASLHRLEELVPEPLYVEHDEALMFTCNSVVVGRRIVMPAVPPRIGRRLESWGFDPVEVDVAEFQKAGGACRCLTLALDVPAPEGQESVAA